MKKDHIVVLGRRLPNCAPEHETCTESECAYEILASPYWEARRLDLIKRQGTAKGDLRTL